GDPGRLGRITFRLTDPTRPASDHTMKFVSVSAAGPPREGTAHFSDGIGCIWRDRYFIPNACDFCDDVFAELADITFMDAWLPEYSRDPLGHSIVIVRDERLMKLFAEPGTGSLEIAPLAIEKVIRSQQAPLDSKRGDIAERLRLAGEYGRKVPRKRGELFSTKLSRLKKMEIMSRWLISRHSGKAWAENNRDLGKFTRAMAPFEAKLSRVKRLYNIRGLLSAAMERLRRLF
ncbi:MAG: Coenzyme F420 hydrogenase/dehydrogenase, beta subunit C-terminal domain, partial [Candidatus Omnitrophica bacterium]|nr:Coenzyme F420 hydrogenase/dehydrogenase, beta subunit C-terminal domain [Candidatus Omnitrophota bacterium]